MKTSLLVALAAAVAVLAVCHVQAQTYMVPMRDGVKLHTIVNLPLFHSHTNLTAVMDRSPYGEDALELIADVYTLWGYAGIRQDMRGTGKSEGDFDMWRSSANDSYDTMQWISTQSWSNGRVYTVGASADGLASFEEPLDSPEWLKAQFIVFASDDGHHVCYPGGAYREELAEVWMNTTVPSQAPHLLEQIKAHEADGVWWSFLEGRGHYHLVDAPAVMWGGWYDIFLWGNLAGFNGYQNLASPDVRGKSRLFIDPLGHCQAGYKYFPYNLIFGRAILPLQMSLELFEGKRVNKDNSSDITWYIMGSDELGAAGNYWTTANEWPRFTGLNMYMSADGNLTYSPPTTSAERTFVYDPANPVPTLGGNNLEIPCGPLDQSELEKRSDMLVFTSDVLHAPVAVTGPLGATLYVSSNATDTDFVVKLTDVHPTGESRLIEDGIIRMRWRDGGSAPKLITPGQVYEVQVSLWNTSFVFNTGHKIRVTVTSSNTPRFSANPNNGLPLIQKGTLITAANSLHIGPETPSHFTLPVVDLADLPQDEELEHHLLVDVPDWVTTDAQRLAWEQTVTKVHEAVMDGTFPPSKMKTVAHNH